MGVKLVAPSNGSIELVPTNTASNFTVTVPAGTGTVAVNGVSSNIVSGTAVASTSGTSIDFTGIPSWVKRITVMFQGVSLSGSSSFLIQIGAGSITSTGYVSTSNNANQASATSGLSSTAGFVVQAAVGASGVASGHMTITNITGNAWVSSHTAKDGTTICMWGGGDVTLGGALDRVRITTVNGTDTFDAGSINILYE
jgi:hypothetical protein